MNEIGSVLFLYTETPLHAGSGVALGAVDLPIQRERMTNLPMVQGSGIKGALREAFREHLNSPAAEDQFLQLFGPEAPDRGKEDPSDREEFAGALSVQDARLLLLPVRTVWGGFAWVTSPLILERLARDLEGMLVAKLEWRASMPKTVARLNHENGLVGTKCTVSGEGRLLMEDLDYKAEADPWVDAVATWLQRNAMPQGEETRPFRERIPGQLVVLTDAEMKFWSEHATEVVARIRINPATGTVKDGALWSEESLPAESMLWSPTFFVHGRRPQEKKSIEPSKPTRSSYNAADLRKHFAGQIAPAGPIKGRIRLGGDRTVGRGIVSVQLISTTGGA
jgi:CRISPR-associated protein Cmr4